MINAFVEMTADIFVGRFLKNKVRRGSIRAVKGYIQGVRFLRLGIMGLFGLGAFASVLVAGIILVVLGIVGLLPISSLAMAITVLVIGVVLACGSGLGSYFLFSQKRWLEASRSYELIDAALAPWPGMMPPNPLDILKGEGPRSDARAPKIAPTIDQTIDGSLRSDLVMDRIPAVP